MKETNLNATLCRKTVQKGESTSKPNPPGMTIFALVSVYGVVRVVRGCGYVTDDRDDKECMKRSGTHDVFAWYCACTSDLCNKSSQLFHQQQITYAILLMPFIYLLNQRYNRQL
jgi:Sleepless protein